MVARNVQIVIYVIGILILLPVLVVAAVDLRLERRQTSVGLHLARWSRRYPLFAAGLIVLLGLVLSHFFWQ
ncbi:MAG TPA: hypothetical protein VOB72_19235 [Candidatus Dormibacteraeota bacterium]|nr:hypothetical protein [Candidatus Dormibacteraeota bacterium]